MESSTSPEQDRCFLARMAHEVAAVYREQDEDEDEKLILAVAQGECTEEDERRFRARAEENPRLQELVNRLREEIRRIDENELDDGSSGIGRLADSATGAPTLSDLAADFREAIQNPTGLSDDCTPLQRHEYFASKLRSLMEAGSRSTWSVDVVYLAQTGETKVSGRKEYSAATVTPRYQTLDVPLAEHGGSRIPPNAARWELPLFEDRLTVEIEICPIVESGTYQVLLAVRSRGDLPGNVHVSACCEKIPYSNRGDVSFSDFGRLYNPMQPGEWEFSIWIGDQIEKVKINLEPFA